MVRSSEHARRTDFIRSSKPEPHAARKVAILKAHPEVKELMGYEFRSKYFMAATVLIQVATACVVQNWSWPWYLAAAYFVGGTAMHSLFLAIHEFSHNLGAPTMVGNKLLMLVANLPGIFPYCMSFKPYHMDHHRYQGEIGVDTDVPTAVEAWLVTGRSQSYPVHCLKKLAVVFGQIFFYIFRPTLVVPDRYPADRWQLLNFVCCFSFDYLLWRAAGFYGILYCLISILFTGSIHPCAGHFIAEHYVTTGSAETYSYYGPLNMVSYNVGYHNEHHDFPNIPGSRLPRLREIAPEFYELPECRSWPGALWNYVFDDTQGPYARVVRPKGSCKAD